MSTEDVGPVQHTGGRLPRHRVISGPASNRACKSRAIQPVSNGLEDAAQTIGRPIRTAISPAVNTAGPAARNVRFPDYLLDEVKEA